jgi:hypothetical protein
MPIEYKQPKLKDSLYGQMFWEDFDEYTEPHWFAKIKNVPNEEFDVIIETDSPLDFMAVRNTHSTYKKLVANLPSIRRQMIENILRNIDEWAENQTERKKLSESLKKPLQIFSIRIYYDLSSEIVFAENGYLDKPIQDWDDHFYVLLDKKGEFLEAGVED